jgi:hypothetical protein
MKRVRYNELDYPGDDGLYYLGDEPFTGVSVSYHKGRIAGETEFRNGMAWGIGRSWHTSGEPASEKQSVAGVFHGLCMEWDERGRMTLYEVYELGVCVSRRRWDGRGRLVEDRRLEKTDNDFKTLEMLRKHFMRGLRELGQRTAEPRAAPDRGGGKASRSPRPPRRRGR